MRKAHLRIPGNVLSMFRFRGQLLASLVPALALAFFILTACGGRVPAASQGSDRTALHLVVRGDPRTEMGLAYAPNPGGPTTAEERVRANESGVAAFRQPVVAPPRRGPVYVLRLSRAQIRFAVRRQGKALEVSFWQGVRPTKVVRTRPGSLVWVRVGKERRIGMVFSASPSA